MVGTPCATCHLLQLDLFENIKPVFVNKPLLIVANKIDARPLEEVAAPLQERIKRIVKDNKATLMLMSNFTEEGVMNVKKTACDQLLAQRVERKHRSNKVRVVRCHPRLCCGHRVLCHMLTLSHVDRLAPSPTASRSRCPSPGTTRSGELPSPRECSGSGQRLRPRWLPAGRRHSNWRTTWPSAGA